MLVRILNLAHYLRHLFLIVWLMSLSFFLVSCSMFGAVKTEPSNQYLIDTVPCNVPKRHTRHVTLLVLPPDTDPVYSTNLMAYTKYPHHVAYFSKNGWAATPSQMLQPLLVQTLQDTHSFRTIVAPPYSGRYDYALSTQILQLEQNFMHCPSVYEITVRAQIIRAATGSVVATRVFKIYEPLPATMNTPYGGVLAANRATATLLQQIAAFCLQKIR